MSIRCINKVLCDSSAAFHVLSTLFLLVRLRGELAPISTGWFFISKDSDLTQVQLLIVSRRERV